MTNLQHSQNSEATGYSLVADPYRMTKLACGYVLIGALAWQVGSGGSVNLQELARSSSGPTTITHTTKSLATRLSLVRRWLSLSVSETARVLHVARPTIYAWQSGQVPNEVKQHRVQELYEVGRSWRDLSSVPVGTRRKLVLPGERYSLVSLLEADTIDRAAIERLLAKVDAMSGRRTATQMAKEHGFGALSSEEAAANIERESQSVGPKLA